MLRHIPFDATSLAGRKQHCCSIVTYVAGMVGYYNNKPALPVVTVQLPRPMLPMVTPTAANHIRTNTAICSKFFTDTTNGTNGVVPSGTTYSWFATPL
jgi:hypothetical protein